MHDSDASYETSDFYASYETSDVVAVAETELALLCFFREGEEIWIPKSQLLPESEVQTRGDVGTLVITRWIAMKNGLL